MEILAGLIRLKNEYALPAPWYNRSHLGLLTGTKVHVAAIKSLREFDAPPDILISPIDVGSLHEKLSISIDIEESVGSISKILAFIESDINIALMETVTTDQRSKHRLVLVVEPANVNPDNRHQSIKKFKISVNKFVKMVKLAFPGTIINPSPVYDASFSIISTELSDVQFGQVKSKQIMSLIEREYGHKYRKKGYDFSRVVVSSSTDGKILRYVFPKAGAFELTIPHKDMPTAMRKVSNLLNDQNYNILSSRVSKSEANVSGTSSSSMIVMICEPASPVPGIKYDNQDYRNATIKKIRDEFISKNKELNPFYFSILDENINLGKNSSRLAYPVRPGTNNGEKTISPPMLIAPYLPSYLTEKRKVIFI
jgi:hypothetical protein